MNPVDQSLEDATPANIQAQDLTDAQLRDFESSVCDNKGCWVYFDKIVPQEEEEKDAAPGGKKLNSRPMSSVVMLSYVTSIFLDEVTNAILCKSPEGRRHIRQFRSRDQ